MFKQMMTTVRENPHFILLVLTAFTPFALLAAAQMGVGIVH